MSGIDAGILVNAHPLTEEQIKQLEKRVLENNEAFAYLNENKELCFTIPQGVDQIKDLAWHKTSELYTDEDNTFIKKVYRRYTSNSYALDTVLRKQNLEDSWGQPGSGGSTASEKTTWVAKTWNGCTSFTASNIWLYDNDVYCTVSNTDYILDKETDTWIALSWNWSEPLNIRNTLHLPWTYGNRAYRSERSQTSGTKIFVLNKETSTWEVATFDGLTFSSQYTFTDGKDTYATSDNLIYKLNKETDLWELWKETIWNESSTYNPGALWFHKGNIYYSLGADEQYILNQETSIWEPKTWNGYTDLWGAHLWRDGEEYMYYSLDDIHYVLDDKTDTWKVKEWGYSPENFETKHDLWTDGEYVYFSKSGEHYVLI